MRKMIAAAALALAACSAPRDIAAVEAAVVQFHARQAAGEDLLIYEEADAGLRDMNSPGELAAINEWVRAASPRCQPPVRDANNWSVNTASGAGHTVELAYARQCEGGVLREFFTYRMREGAPRLLTYRARGEPTRGVPSERTTPPPPGDPI